MLAKSLKYLSDGFTFRKRALFKANEPLDFTYETSCNGFEIGGTEPDDCNRRVIFQIDDALYRFGANGVLDEYGNLGELEDILKEGNTVGELLALESIPAFVGKKVFPIIAMDAPADTPIFPRIKLSAKVNCYNDVYTRYTYSPVYDLAEKAKIIEVQASRYTRGNGIANVQCKVKNPLTGWGDWISLEDAKYKLAAAIQFRVQYILSALDGSDEAIVEEVAVHYTTNADLLSGSTRDIICLPQTCDADLGTCYALINHGKLIDCTVKAYAKFEKPLKRRADVTIDPQQPYLADGGVVDAGIVQDSIHLEQAGKPVDDFYFDTEKSLIGNVATDAALTASYDCGLENEDWREMSPDIQSDYSSKFIYRLTDADKKISAVKFIFTKKGGSFSGALGIGTGKILTFALPHKVKNVSVNAPFKADGILKVIASANQTINLNYDFNGEFPAVYNFLVGWEAK